jgi:hypothetical protein
MRYIDTGSRDPVHSLAAWLQAVLTDEVAEVRWQTGFFNEEPLGLFAPTLRRLATTGGHVSALIGSNPPGTQRDDVLQLVRLMGVPRANARIGVIQFGSGFYHPKTYHFCRADGSQCAYVGSANLTAPGVSSLHIEAGLTLDTAEGDPVGVLNEIAAAVDAWFDEERDGLHLVLNAAAVAHLVTDGVLIVAPPPPPPAPPAIAEDEEVEAAAAGGGAAAPRRRRSPRLSSLVNLPPLPSTLAPAAAVTPAPTPAAATWRPRTLLVILVHNDTQRIQADRQPGMSLGSQYFFLGKDCGDFFPELTIPNERGEKATWSCEIEMHFMDIEQTYPRCRVTYEEDNNKDFRLGTGAYTYTKVARAGDLAAISRVGQAEYELRILPQTGPHFAALERFARTPIGHAGKRYGYVPNADLARVIGEPVPNPTRTNAFDEYHPRRRN